MADREQAIKGLTEISEYARVKADIAGIGKGKEVFDSWYRAAEDAIALLREQEPRVLTVNEVKRIGADNHGSFKNDGPTVMWLEEFGKQYPLHVVVLKWDEDDWQGEPNDIVDVYYFGTDEYDHFSLTDYNKTWRCWTDKPTETQREAVKWDE